MAKNGYPIRAVARMTGISLDTLRAWERRYRAVEPQRGPLGRIYGERDVARLTLLRELVGRGHAIGQVAALPDRQLQSLLAEAGRHPAAGDRTAPVHGLSGVALPALLSAVERFDSLELNRQLGRLAVMLSPRELVHELVHPLMRTVGEGWHDGRYTIAQEHLVSAGLRHLLGGLIRVHIPDGPRTTLLLATPAGELHEFGILAAALLAAAGGLKTVYLGPSLPAAEIVRSTQLVAPNVVVLAIAADNHEAESEVRVLAKKLPTGVELWLGGQNGLNGGSGRRQNRWISLHDFQELERHLVRLGAQF